MFRKKLEAKSDFFGELWGVTKKVAAFLLAVITVVTTFISTEDILNKVGLNHLRWKIVFLISLCCITGIIAVIVTIISIRITKEVLVYKGGDTEINVCYGDIRQYITDKSENTIEKHNEYTVIIPINGDMNIIDDYVGFEEKGKTSLHCMFLRQMKDYCEKKNPEIKGDVSKTREAISTIINQALGKSNESNERKPTKKEVLPIGNWIYLPQINGVNYLLIVSAEIKEESKHIFSKTNDIQFVTAVQAMYEAIHLCRPGNTCFYIPIIAGGNGRQEHSKIQLLRLMTEIAVYNKSNLNTEINIVVNENDKKKIPIYSLKS